MTNSVKHYTIRLEGQTHALSEHSPFRDLFPKQEKEGFPLVAVLYNNELCSLNKTPDINGSIEGIYLNSEAGVRIYRKSLCLLLEIAGRQLFPERRLFLSHALGRSYYYHLAEGRPFNTEELKAMEKKMRELVEEDIPIVPDTISWEEAVDYFESHGQKHTVMLLESSNKSRIPVNRAGDYISLRHDVLLPSTACLKCFDLMNYEEGFLLRYPSSRSPLALSPFRDEPLLFSIYKEYKTWGKILNADTVGKMNAMVADRNQMEHFIQVAESLHNKKIGQIADEVLARKEEVKVLFIAGPSSSGKTTFTKKLCIQLQVVGFTPLMISLDDYYLPHHKIPLNEEGKPDLEALEALDVPLLNDNLTRLFKGEETEIPVFDFKKGGRLDTGRKLRMQDRSIIVMEGIHGLNRNLTPAIPDRLKFRVYISALTQLNLNDHDRIATTDNRLIRRIVRDHQFRSYNAGKTLKIWPSVRAGEKKNIFPNQDQADAAFNSALDYELAVLKVYALPLLKSISPRQKEYGEAQRLLRFLNNFSAIPAYMVPGNSILREFIGNSSFKY